MKVIDLFCGAGGFSCGFQQAGFDIVFGIDWEVKSCETFAFNFPNAEVCCADVMTYKNYPQADVVIGGPPCKEYSIGNNKRTFDDKEVARFFYLLRGLKPKYWIMENVVGVKAVLDRNIHYRILSSHHYGGATRRKRLFAMSHKLDLEPKQGKVVRDVINVDSPGFRQPYKSQEYRNINIDEPLITLTEARISNECYVLPNGRSLGISEMAMLQGFPDNFIFVGGRSHAQQMIGKSVCPNVAKTIAEAIKQKEGVRKK